MLYIAFVVTQRDGLSDLLNGFVEMTTFLCLTFYCRQGGSILRCDSIGTGGSRRCRRRGRHTGRLYVDGQQTTEDSCNGGQMAEEKYQR